MGIKTDTEIADFRERLKEVSIHEGIDTFILAVVIYAAKTFIHNDIVYRIMGPLSIGIFIFMLTRKVSYKHLIIYSRICFACVMTFAVSFGSFNHIQMLLPMMVYICLLDVYSFTRKGKNTFNAKLVNSNTWSRKLIVYGRSFKNGSPVATKGLGDYFWYAFSFSTIYSKFGQLIGLYSIIAIVLGLIINLLIICRIYKYTWYKGFPATTGPLGLCFILVVIVLLVN